MSQPAGEETVAAQADTVGSRSPQTRWWMRLLAIQFSAVLLVPIGVVMVPVSALLAYTVDSRYTWVSYMMMGIGGGWVAPTLVLFLALASKVFLSVRVAVYERHARRASSLVISMVAARTCHYEKAGVPEPSTAAALDVAAALNDGVSSVQRGRWVIEGLDWYEIHVAGRFPPPPARLRKMHQRFVEKPDKPQ